MEVVIFESAAFQKLEADIKTSRNKKTFTQNKRSKPVTMKCGWTITMCAPF